MPARTIEASRIVAWSARRDSHFVGVRHDAQRVRCDCHLYTAIDSEVRVAEFARYDAGVEGEMATPKPDPDVSDEIAWSEEITPYDESPACEGAARKRHAVEHNRLNLLVGQIQEFATKC